MTAIAVAELRMLVRNRLVALSAILIPVAFAAGMIAFRDLYGGSAIIAPMIVLVIATLGVYMTPTTTLAARRQNLFLKRLRSTSASDSGILAGLIVPLVVINIVQLGAILVTIAIVGEAPANPVFLTVTVLAVEAMFLAFALVTAGVTTSAEHAQFTTLPIFMLSLGVSFWIAFTGTAEQTLIKRLLPGGAAAELITETWTGIAATDALLLLLPTLAWVVVGLVLAPQMFRWEPRR